MDHLLSSTLLQRRVRVQLAGVGGNGAQMAARLARLDIAMRALGHPYGLHVTACDSARVSPANIGRQLYSESDIGQYKAVLTVHRLNQFYGLDWEADPVPIEQHWRRTMNTPDFLISCVDSREARRIIHQSLTAWSSKPAYWLDLGNTEKSGQVVLGQPGDGTWPGQRCPNTHRLPTVTELFPDLLDTSVVDDDAPSCSVRMSLATQGLFVNDAASVLAAQLLYELFSRGRISHHGAIFNLDAKRSGPIAVDWDTWQRFGLAGPDSLQAAP